MPKRRLGKAILQEAPALNEPVALQAAHVRRRRRELGESDLAILAIEGRRAVADVVVTGRGTGRPVLARIRRARAERDATGLAVAVVAVGTSPAAAPSRQI